MTGTTVTSADLDRRRRRLLFRAWHRGIREMDLVLGSFADREIAAMTNSELDDFEALLEIDDLQLLKWVTGQTPTPADVATPMFARLSAFDPAMFSEAVSER